MLLKLIGLFFVGLAMLGVALPLLPTTPFLLIAAACFAKSSKKLHQKLLEHRLFGPMIKNWQQNRSMTKRAKISAFMTIAISISFSFYMLDSALLRGILILLILFPLVILYRLPTAPSQ